MNFTKQSSLILDESPTYINPSQYRRILSRRSSRSHLLSKLSHSLSRSTYKHESRHRHAVKRPRGKGGRFLTKDELEGYYEGNREEAGLRGGVGGGGGGGGGGCGERSEERSEERND